MRDVPGARDGGADRLTLVAYAEDPETPVSPEVQTAAAVIRAAGDLPVRVLLRARPQRVLPATDFTELLELAREVVGLGAEGVVLGALDADLAIDADTVMAFARALPGVPLTFDRTIDLALEPARAWATVLGLPGVVSIASAGSPRGLEAGFDDLLALARRDLRVAECLEVTGGLAPEHVPWLTRAGVARFQIGAQARPGGSARAYVDAGFVRSWRLLLDDLHTDRSSAG